MNTAANTRELRLVALSGVPLVRPGDDLCRMVLGALGDSGETLQTGDVLVLAQKIVSKARGRHVDLSRVSASARALQLAETVDKDPRLIELILSESSEVLRVRRDVMIVVHRLGFVMANAGIDLSNVDGNAGDTRALLLPSDPDGECEQLRRALLERTGAGVALGLDTTSLRPGDLLYFAEGDARVSHVAISLGGSHIIHSALGNGGVNINDLSGDLPIERRLGAMFVSARRMLAD